MRTPIDDCATTRARKRMNQQRRPCAWRSDGRSIGLVLVLVGRWRRWRPACADDGRWKPFGWPRAGLGGGSSLLFVALVLLAALFLVQSAGGFSALPARASSSSYAYEGHSLRPPSPPPNGATRPARRLAAQQQVNANDNSPIPYRTFFVTQACEWKSNLFVPKSNDLHFAQAGVESLAGAKLASSAAGQAAPNALGQQESRTILSSTQKALILALPIELGASFAGFEPACSIRLIVPRNMRILAKLTARKLSFAPQVGSAFGSEPPGELQATLLQQAPPDQHRQLWLNVSSDHFGELEQRELESESNVLAFRFLLERFAHLREPETRFQVVVSAFQTLGENSDFNQANPVEAGQQFICDSQRLISSTLLCDGFPNCQDGRDENPADCAAFRQQGEPPAVGQQPVLDAARNQTAPGQPLGEKPSTNWPSRLASATSPFVGFLLGLLLVLLLLTCCTCCLYCLYLLLRNALFGRADEGQAEELEAGEAARRRRLRAVRHLLGADGGERRRHRSLFSKLNFRALGLASKATEERSRAARSGGEETDSLARHQNAENAARLAKAQAGLLGPAEEAAGLPPAPAHSILKRPAPLARFESIRAHASGGSGLPVAQAPPGRPSERAVDVGSSGDELPAAARTPRGALAHSLTQARDSARRAHDFRPTPAARGQPRQPATTPHRSQDFAPTASQTSGPTSGRGRRALQPQPQPQPQASEQLRYRSSSSQVEQTSAQTAAGHRLTVYQYSSSVAQFSESYLLRQQHEQPPVPSASEQPPAQQQAPPPR